METTTRSGTEWLGYGAVLVWCRMGLILACDQGLLVTAVAEFTHALPCFGPGYVVVWHTYVSFVE